MSVTDRITARLDSRALLSNYEVLTTLAKGQALLPMLKADGYGHGALWVAQQLQDHSGLYAFGVATVEEGLELRQELGVRSKRVPICVFSGASPWTDELGQMCERHNLIPVIFEEKNWEKFLRGGWPARIAYELKFNTGMNRLGMAFEYHREVIRALSKHPSGWAPRGVFSHLACAESAEHTLTRQQVERFKVLRQAFEGQWSQIQFHLANSAGIWNLQKLGLHELTDVVRPGLALYGVRPDQDFPTRGLTPVMTLEAPVVQVRHLKVGESVGYGASFRVGGKDHPRGMSIAVCAGGYGDGVPRGLGPKGKVLVEGEHSRFIGRVSMDLLTVSATSRTKIGTWVEIFGKSVDIWEQAQAAGVIPYELLTGISLRVPRVS